MHRVCGLHYQDNSCKACFMHGCPHAWHMPRVGYALLHSLLLQSPSAAVRWSALMELKVTKEWGPRCGILSVLLLAAFLASLWGSLKRQLLCETFDFSPPYPLPQRSLCLSTLPSCWAWKSPASFSSSLACLTGSEIHIQPQSSDPQNRCCVSDTIKEQIRQSVKELAKQRLKSGVGSRI